jgi:hypothetical protein
LAVISGDPAVREYLIEIAVEPEEEARRMDASC